MNEVQVLIQELKSKGWTMAAIADELGIHYNTIQRWVAGERTPTNSKAVAYVLKSLLKRKQIPKGKRYTKASG